MSKAATNAVATKESRGSVIQFKRYSVRVVSSRQWSLSNCQNIIGAFFTDFSPSFPMQSISGIRPMSLTVLSEIMGYGLVCFLYVFLMIIIILLLLLFLWQTVDWRKDMDSEWEGLAPTKTWEWIRAADSAP